MVIKKPGERFHLMYVEDVSNNHPGGLKIKPKIVYHNVNIDKQDT